MKTIEQFRARKLEYLQFLVKCPERVGVVDQEMGTWLSDMLFIDERFGAWEKEKQRLVKTGRYSTLGVKGPLQWGLPRPLRADFVRPMGQEIVSVYAEVLWRLGYLEVARTLSAGEFRGVRDGVMLFSQGDWHVGEVVSRLGEASLVINGGNPARRCLCYVAADKEVPWVCFDFEFLLEGYGAVGIETRGEEGDEEREEVVTLDGKPWWEHGDHVNGDPLLRDVRVPGMKGLENGMVVTGYGKRVGMNPFGMRGR